MKTLGFYGASDDLFIAEIDGHPTDELSDAARGTTMAFLVQSESAGAGLIVTAIYEHPLTEPNWVIGVTMRSETDPLPEWPMRVENQPIAGGTLQTPYSPRLIVEAPDDVTITEVTP